jgi:hypothetical protein
VVALGASGAAQLGQVAQLTQEVRALRRQHARQRLIVGRAVRGQGLEEQVVPEPARALGGCASQPSSSARPAAVIS